MIRLYHYRHQRKLGVPPSAYPTALLRVVLSCWEAVAETAVLPKSFQMLEEGGFSEAVDRHRVSVPDDAVADLLPDLRRDASAGLGFRSAWRGRRASSLPTPLWTRVSPGAGMKTLEKKGSTVRPAGSAREKPFADPGWSF